MRYHAAVLLAALALGGCTAAQGQSQAFLPDPYFHRPARVAPRGSEDFCRNYAEQTAQSVFESRRMDDDLSMADPEFLARREAERAGASAYRRCRSGRLN